MQHRGGRDEHAGVDEPGEPEREDDVDHLEPEHLAPLLGGAADHAPLGERRVQVDDVRHHGRAEDADGEQDRAAAGERGDESAGDLGGLRAREEHLRAERQHDHEHEPRDERLELANATLLHREDGEGDDGRDEGGGQQRHTEEQVDRDRRPQELGEVAGHRGELALEPEADARTPAELSAAHLGQVQARGDAEFGAKGLDQHRHEVGGDDHPEERVAELGAAADVGREVARVDVGDGGHEGRAEERQQALDPAAAGVLERAQRRLVDARLAGERTLRLAGRIMDQLHSGEFSPG